MLIKKYFLFVLTIMLLLVITQASNAAGIQIPQNTGLPDGTFVSVLDNILNWTLKIFVVIATISFVVTGLQFIFSFGGASGSEAQAKKNLTYTIIAIFIVGGSLIILKTIIGLLGPSNGGGSANNNIITNGNGGYPDNDAIEGNNNAGLQNDASHNADNPTQQNVPSNPTINRGGYPDNDSIEGNRYDPVVPGSDDLRQSDMPHKNF